MRFKCGTKERAQIQVATLARANTSCYSRCRTSRCMQRTGAISRALFLRSLADSGQRKGEQEGDKNREKGRKGDRAGGEQDGVTTSTIHARAREHVLG